MKKETRLGGRIYIEELKVITEISDMIPIIDPYLISAKYKDL